MNTFCEKHKIKFNSETSDTCPLCVEPEIKEIELIPDPDEHEVKIKVRKFCDLCNSWTLHKNPKCLKFKQYLKYKEYLKSHPRTDYWRKYSFRRYQTDPDFRQRRIDAVARYRISTSASVHPKAEA